MTGWWNMYQECRKSAVKALYRKRFFGSLESGRISENPGKASASLLWEAPEKALCPVGRALLTF